MEKIQFIKRPSHHSGKDQNSISRCCAETASEVSDLQCLCGDTETQQPDLENSPAWATGILKTSRGPVYTTSHRLTWGDYFGEIKSRVSGFRMKYSIQPGLYAVGKPDRDSDILVTANYKLSFDKLRMHLRDQHVWILVLDTSSINVWCAAGKGTFGTEELVKRMQAARLDILVTHRRIILPQLSAPGVNAKEVRKQTGFRVYFGPVHAKDIGHYMKSGYTASDEMRTIQFSLLDRLVLTPMELNPAMKKFPLLAVLLLVISGLSPAGIIFKDAWEMGMPLLVLGIVAVISGAFLTPVFLPFIPFRSFAIKGFIMGLLSVALSLQLIGGLNHYHILMGLIAYLFFPLVSSYIALQFTGSTTFTGMSGVQRELKISIPLYITGIVLSVVLLIIVKIQLWGII